MEHDSARRNEIDETLEMKDAQDGSMKAGAKREADKTLEADSLTVKNKS